MVTACPANGGRQHRQMRPPIVFSASTSNGRHRMAQKLSALVSLTAALAALPGVTAPAAASAPSTNEAAVAPQGRTNSGNANVFLPVGSDLLGLTVSTAADGTTVAQHDSHYSHSSHASHSSHYSSSM